MKKFQKFNAIKYFSLVSVLMGFSALAAPVTPTEARKAVSNWLRMGDSFSCPLGMRVESSRVCKTKEGATFHVVKLEGSGFVVTSADTQIEPIIAFSSGKDLIEDDKNPLWCLLQGDLEAREKAMRAPRALAMGPNPARLNVERWDRLIKPMPMTLADGKNSISDIRVAPLIQSQWSQGSHDGYDDPYSENTCYNYYTPNHYPCGCVATAGAQIMRYHQYPTEKVVAETYQCAVDGIETTLTMLGGSYAWGRMPLLPAEGVTEQERQSIGKLTSDVGISCLMGYGPDGSSAGYISLADSLVSRFHYSNAKYIYFTNESGYEFPYSLARLKNAVIPNLDADLPVGMGVDGVDGGHAIIADGYGYENDQFYIHVNLGWSGLSDAWYLPPDIESFTVIDELVYNIYPTQAKDAVIVSGRVLSEQKIPQKNITVSTRLRSGETVSCKTDDEGIYALILPPGTYSLTAGTASMQKDIELIKCISLEHDGEGGFGWKKQAMGNLCDQNIILGGMIEPPPEEHFALSVFSSDPTHGTVSAGADETEAGRRVSVKAAPVKGYFFVGWYTDSDLTKPFTECGADYRAASLSFVMPEHDVTLYARFVSAEEDGKIDVWIPDLEEEGYPAGEQIELSVNVESLTTPKISARGLPIGTRFDVKRMLVYGTPTKPGIYTAIFSASNLSIRKPIQIPIDIKIQNYRSEFIGMEDSYEGMVPGVPIKGIPVGEDVKVSGLPSGLKFNSRTGIIEGTPAKPGNYTATFTKKMKDPYTGKTRTEIETSTFAVGPYPNLEIVVEGGEKCGGVKGAGAYPANKKVSLRASAEKGYVFAGWSVENEDWLTTDFRNPSTSFIMPGEDTVISASFIPAEEDQEIGFDLPEGEEFVAGIPLSISIKVDSKSLPKVSVRDLPPGLEFDSKTLKIEGQPSKPGEYTSMVSASNVSRKTPASEQFKLVILPFRSDFIDDMELSKFTPGKEITDVTLQAGMQVKGLPSGMKYDKKTGKITGTPKKPGSYDVLWSVKIRDPETGKVHSEQESNTIVVGALPKLTVEMPGNEDGLMGTISGDGEYPANKKVSLRAKPAKGYVFAGWYADPEFTQFLSLDVDYRTPSVSLLMPESDLTVFARFVEERFYPLSIEVEPEYCLTPGVPFDTPIIVDSPVLPSVKVKGLPGGVKWNAKSMRLEGAAKKPGEYSATITASAKGCEPAEITVPFIVDDFPALKLECDPARGTVTGGGAYAANKKISLRAEPNKGFVFAGWYFDSDFKCPLAEEMDYRSPSCSLMMPEDVDEDGLTLYARFVTPEEDQNISSYLERPEFSAEPGVPILLQLDVQSCSLPSVKVKGLPKGTKWNDKTHTITGAPTVPGIYTLEFTVANVTRKRDPEIYREEIRISNLRSDEWHVNDDVGGMIPGAYFSWEDDAETLKGCTVKGLPPGLKFNDDTGVISGTPTKPGDYTVTITKQVLDRYGFPVPETVTAYYRVAPFPHLYVECDSGMGSVKGAGDYAANKKVSLKATPAKGYIFTGWILEEPERLDADSRMQSASFAMTEYDTEIKAGFAPMEDDYLDDISILDFNYEEGYPVGTPLSLQLEVGSLSFPKVTVKGLPSGLKWNSKTLRIEGTPKKVGSYELTFRATNTTVKREPLTSSIILKVYDPELVYFSSAPLLCSVPGVMMSTVGLSVARKQAEAASTYDVAHSPLTLVFNAAMGNAAQQLEEDCNTIQLDARPAVGYVFAGWYADPEWKRPLTGDVDYRAPIFSIDPETLSSKTIYARFEKQEDDDSIILSVPDAEICELEVPLCEVDPNTPFEIQLRAESLSFPEVTVEGLPEGMTFDPFTLKLSGKAVVPGVYDALFVAKNATLAGEDETALLEVLIRVGNINELIDAEDYDVNAVWAIKSGEPCSLRLLPEVADASVSGLPLGLEWNTETLQIEGLTDEIGWHTVIFEKDGLKTTVTLEVDE